MASDRSPTVLPPLPSTPDTPAQRAKGAAAGAVAVVTEDVAENAEDEAQRRAARRRRRKLGLFKSDRECPEGAGNYRGLLLPLRPDGYLPAPKPGPQELAAPGPGKTRVQWHMHDENELFQFFDETTIHMREHKARKRREISCNRKAHTAYEKRLAADEAYEIKKKQTKAEALRESAAKAKATALKGKDSDAEDDIDDTDPALAAERLAAAAAAREAAGQDPLAAMAAEAEAAAGEGNADVSKPIDPPMERMPLEEAQQVILTSVPLVREFAREATDISKARLMSPYDRKRYWEGMQDRAIRVLMRMIELKDVEKASAAFAVLCEIGTVPADQSKSKTEKKGGEEEDENAAGSTGKTRKKKKKKEKSKKEKESDADTSFSESSSDEEELDEAAKLNAERLARFKAPPKKEVVPVETLKSQTQRFLRKMGPLVEIDHMLKEGLTLAHWAAGVGSVPMLKLVVEAWGGSLMSTAWGYTVYQHALNSVSKGLSDETCLDWLQLHGGFEAVNPDSKVGAYTQSLLAAKQARDDAKDQAKKDAKEAKVRARRKKRASRARSKSPKS